MQTLLKMMIALTMTSTAFAMSLFQYPQTSNEQIAMEEAQAIQKGCIPVKRNISAIPITGKVKGSGKFCLVQDLVQRRLRSLDDGSIAGSPSDNGHGIVIFYDIKDVQLDLQGHLVSASPFENTEGVIPSGLAISASKW